MHWDTWRQDHTQLHTDVISKPATAGSVGAVMAMSRTSPSDLKFSTPAPQPSNVDTSLTMGWLCALRGRQTGPQIPSSFVCIYVGCVGAMSCTGCFRDKGGCLLLPCAWFVGAMYHVWAEMITD